MTSQEPPVIEAVCPDWGWHFGISGWPTPILCGEHIRLTTVGWASDDGTRHNHQPYFWTAGTLHRLRWEPIERMVAGLPAQEPSEIELNAPLQTEFWIEGLGGKAGRHRLDPGTRLIRLSYQVKPHTTLVAAGYYTYLVSTRELDAAIKAKRLDAAATSGDLYN